MAPDATSSSAAATGAVFFKIEKIMSSLPGTCRYFFHARQMKPNENRRIATNNIASITSMLDLLNSMGILVRVVVQFQHFSWSQ
mmetsp:Transcript_17945/g.43140  ORF Transcript_17945/g.43140 Transcript_17945/m.43140 type:complete len:84 (+) Transcript_17945:1316-1567(+)